MPAGSDRRHPVLELALRVCPPEWRATGAGPGVFRRLLEQPGGSGIADSSSWHHCDHSTGCTVTGPSWLCLRPRASVLPLRGHGWGRPVVVPQPSFLRATGVLGGFGRGSSLICAVLCLQVGFDESFLLLKKDLMQTAGRRILPAVPAHTSPAESAAVTAAPGRHAACLWLSPGSGCRLSSPSASLGKAGSAAGASSHPLPCAGGPHRGVGGDAQAWPQAGPPRRPSTGRVS